MVDTNMVDSTMLGSNTLGAITICLVVVGVGAAVLATQIIYNLFFSPLREIPGPLLAKITPYWLIFIDMAGNRTSRLHRLHEQYGPTIRVGPNEVSFSNQEIVKEIYGQQTAFMKAPVYDSMSVPPIGIFSFRNKQQHSQRRRLLSHAFSQANISHTEPLIREHIKCFVDLMDQKLGVPVDVFTTFRTLSFDIVGELFLGQKFHGLTAASPPQFLADMDAHFILSGLQHNFAPLYHFLSVLPIPSLQHYFNARKRLVKYGEDAFNAYIRQYGRNSGRRDLLTKVLTSKSDDGPPLTDVQIYTEISNLVFAGTDTTSTTLTYLFWTLAERPEWQTRLRDELATVDQASWTDGIPKHAAIANLPLLGAVISEALRLYPAAPSSLLRETPTGGKVLNGIFIPEKTVVSMQCYTTQRDPRVFPHPESFRPERWLGDAGNNSDMNTMFMPFSAGTRACLGINLAWMELKVITAALVKHYHVHLAPGTTPESMDMIDHFLLMPKAAKCDLIFTKVK